MQSSDKLTIYAIKLLLSKRSSNFSIRLLIAIVESWGKGVQFDFSTHGEKVFFSWDTEDLKDFLKTPSCEKFRITNDFQNVDSNTAGYSLYINGLKIPFFVPIKVGSKKTMTTKDLTTSLIENSFSIWLEEVGSDKNVFKKTPKLTTSKDGRKHWITKAYEQCFVSSLEEFRLVCQGCRNSPYHMGFEPKTGEKRNKAYCDIKNIFVNRQRAEEMMARAHGMHYLEQLNLLKEKKEEQEKKIEEIYSFGSPENTTPTNTDDDLDDGKFF
ncbi:hypothetical protein [Vibrio crassostreae]|uniref:hypothetical protein n=1 Tax=Vibrio crassostreae TaxID=246167 RepID=UPI001B308B62|nr:hypothetical protein [Vibrio crassostreae]